MRPLRPELICKPIMWHAQKKLARARLRCKQGLKCFCSALGMSVSRFSVGEADHAEIAHVRDALYPNNVLLQLAPKIALPPFVHGLARHRQHVAHYVSCVYRRHNAHRPDFTRSLLIEAMQGIGQMSPAFIRRLANIDHG